VIPRNTVAKLRFAYLNKRASYDNERRVKSTMLLRVFNARIARGAANTSLPLKPMHEQSKSNPNNISEGDLYNREITCIERCGYSR